MADQNHDEELNKILKLLFNKYNIKEGYDNLYYHLSKEKKSNKCVTCVKNILEKISKNPFNQYLFRDGNSFIIYYSLFKALKSIQTNQITDIGNYIFFEIINSIFKIDSLELNKVNIIIEIIKGEEFFMLQHFENIFEKIIIQLLLEKQPNKIKEGYYLDQILKEGIESLYQKNYNNNDEDIIGLLKSKFDEMYRYLITKLEGTNNQQIKLLVISWFNCLQSFPLKNLSENYNEIITKILNIINSDNKKESDLGELYLKKIINDIIASYDTKELDYIKNIIKIIIKDNYSESNNEFFQKILFELLNKFLEKFEDILNIPKYDEKLLLKKIPFDLFPQILKFILLTLINLNKNSNTTETNKIKNSKPIIKSNSIFFRIMEKVKPKYYIFENILNEENCFEKIIDIKLLKNLDENSTNLVFDWICQLYNSKLYKDENFLQNLINTIQDLKEFHIKRIIGVMYLMKSNSKEFDTTNIINKILVKFDDLEFAENYGFFILNQLSDESNETMNIVDIFKEIANNLDQNLDINFVSNIISLLTNYLIKEEKGKIVIDALKSDPDLFQTLYKVFCYNSFDTLAFLLLSKYFELSYFFVLYLSRMELESSDLIYLNKAIEVFESQFFIDVRIQLLNPQSNIYLTKTLYAISLILPPGKALDALSYRLKCLEILYDFDEDENDNNFEPFNNDINDNDSSKPNSETSEINLSSKDLDEKNVNQFLQYLDENDKIIFEQQNLENYIKIFETQTKKIRNYKRKNQLKNRTFKMPKI